MAFARGFGGVRRGVVVLAGLALGGAVAFLMPTARAEDPVPVERVQELPIEDFLRLVEPKLGVRLAWDSSLKLIKDKRIAVRLPDVKPDRLLAYVRSILVPYDLAMIPLGTGSELTYFILDAKQQGAIVKLKPVTIDLNEQNLARYETEDGLFVTAVVRVEALRTLRDARQALTKLITQNLGNVTEVPDSNAFVVTDFAPNAVAVYRMIRRLDVAPPDPATVTLGRLVSLKHARAETMAKMLTAHFAPPVPTLRQPNPTGAADPLPPGPGPRITPDPRTNQILVGGTAGEMQALLKLIEGLDVPVEGGATQAPAATTTRVQVLPLKNADPGDLQNTVQQLAGNSPAWFTSDGMRPMIVADRARKLLIVVGIPKAVEEIRALVESLDAIPAER